jgi:hypothetical protein
MRLKKIIFYSFILLLILFPFILWFTWIASPSHQLNIFVMDKSMTSKESGKHSGLFWVLANEKIERSNGKLYSSQEDYFGFFPHENSKYAIKDLSKYSNTQLDSLSETIDVAYYADTYGVSNDEWQGKEPKYKYSLKMYGGLEENDYLFLKKMIAKKKPIIAEFNFFAKPTSDGIRKKTEKLLGLKWSGWTGRYFEMLDTTIYPELPRWIVNLYKETHNGKWPFKKAGIVFVHDEKVVVLENETDLLKETPQIITWQAEREKYSLPYCINYSGWFDITYPVDTGGSIVSYFKIATNRQGDSLLESEGVPRVFPAVIENNNKLYYFCGDFNDVLLSTRFAGVKGIGCIERLLNSKESAKNRTAFFWHYYLPLMEKILETY